MICRDQPLICLVLVLLIHVAVQECPIYAAGYLIGHGGILAHQRWHQDYRGPVVFLRSSKRRCWDMWGETTVVHGRYHARSRESKAFS